MCTEECKHETKHTRIVPVAGTAVGRTGRGNREATRNGFHLLLLDGHRSWRKELGTLRARDLALLPRFVASAKLVETQRSGAQMCPLVQTTLVADDLSRCQGRTTP